jgi:hypothetical protein
MKTSIQDLSDENFHFYNSLVLIDDLTFQRTHFRITPPNIPRLLISVIYFNCAYLDPTNPNLGDRRGATIHRSHLGALLETAWTPARRVGGGQTTMVFTTVVKNRCRHWESNPKLVDDSSLFGTTHASAALATGARLLQTLHVSIIMIRDVMTTMTYPYKTDPAYKTTNYSK